jgi:hypothetical protein
MTPVLACLVCARPLDALLTGGLHAGVLVLALAAVIVIGGLGWGAARLLREDRAMLHAERARPDRAGRAPAVRGGA